MTDSNFSLKATIRELRGKKVNELREQGQIPAVLYGHGIEPKNLAVNYSEFEKVFKGAGESTLVDLIIGQENPVKVLIQDCQLDPLSNKFLHIDFHQIRMDEKIHTEIELDFFGEPPAVKELSGVLVTNRDTIEIECLPKDLVHKIKVDMTGLKTFDDAVHVSDIKIPDGITVLTVADDVIVLVQPPRTEKEIEALEEKPEAEAEIGEAGEEGAEAKTGEEGTDNNSEQKDKDAGTEKKPEDKEKK